MRPYGEKEEEKEDFDLFLKIFALYFLYFSMFDLIKKYEYIKMSHKYGNVGICFGPYY
jgi:hypothetical protein